MLIYQVECRGVIAWIHSVRRRTHYFKIHGWRLTYSDDDDDEALLSVSQQSHCDLDNWILWLISSELKTWRTEVHHDQKKALKHL